MARRELFFIERRLGGHRLRYLHRQRQPLGRDIVLEGFAYLLKQYAFVRRVRVHHRQRVGKVEDQKTLRALPHIVFIK